MTTIRDVIEDADGGVVTVSTEHESVEANVITARGGWDLGGAGPDFLIAYPGRIAFLKYPKGVLRHRVVLYSQRDPRWRNEVYAGGLTFGQAGCYTVTVAMMVSLAGYDDDPPTVAAKLREAGCFSGALLGRPDRIVNAYPLMCYDGPVDVSHDGPLRWHHGVADMTRFSTELAEGPCIIEVDFIPPTQEFNQHFVIAEYPTDGGGDIAIADPWDGTRTKLLERYAQTHWSLKRALYGMRLLRVK